MFHPGSRDTPYKQGQFCFITLRKLELAPLTISICLPVQYCNFKTFCLQPITITQYSLSPQISTVALYQW